MSRNLLLIVPLALALSACGSPTRNAEPTNDASLTVRHVSDPHSPPVYIEGAVWHVRIVDHEGARLIDRLLQDDRTSASLSPGKYRLESDELPCSVNCENLTPPTDPCVAEFLAEPGDELLATVTVRQAHGCTIDFGA